MIGALFFVADTYWVRSEGESDNHRITISRPDVELINERYLKQMGRVPTTLELSSLVDAQIREEVLYREAIAMGLDKDDTIVRRRLAQKLEFLSQDMLVPEEPDEPTFVAYYNNNVERYRRPERLMFAHIYFSEDEQGSRAQAEAVTVSEALNAEGAVISEGMGLGDPSPVKLNDVFYTADQVTRLFGRSFAVDLFSLETSSGSWRGPIQSGYGWHLVRISGREDSVLPELSEIKEHLLRDWQYETRQAENDRLYEILKTRYVIEVEGFSEDPQVE